MGHHRKQTQSNKRNSSARVLLGALVAASVLFVGGVGAAIADPTSSATTKEQAIASLDRAQAEIENARKFLVGSPTTTPPSSTTTNPPPTSTTPPTTTTPNPGTDTGTAASRFGWGTPIASMSDEFNYTGQPDPTKWAAYNGPGHDGNGRRVASANQVQNGALVQTGTSNGDSAGLAARKGQKYGRWEARARSYALSTSNSSRSYHPLLILWPDSDKWPAGAEYDYLETSKPGQDCAEAFLHYPNHQPKRQEYAKKCGVDLSKWHNFAIEWKPNLLVGYIDGQEWFRFTGQVANAPGPMHQTIQLDNFFGGSMQPAKFEVDWVRAYAVG